jgi:hypothetical protein
MKIRTAIVAAAGSIARKVDDVRAVKNEITVRLAA